MIELATGGGRRFRTQAFIELHGYSYDLDVLDAAERRALMTALDVQGLNAAFSGEMRFSAEGEPLEEIVRALESGGKGIPLG